MVVLQCNHCGHEIEVSDSMRGAGIRCARCGNPLSAKAVDSAKTEIGPPPLLGPAADADFGDGQAAQPTSHLGNGETLAPKPAAQPVSFAFLSPAQGPNELGWLGHYRVLRMLGQGGMGIVLEAVDTRLQRSVALKVLKPEFAKENPARQRFLREAQALAAVKSDHVVTVHEVGQNSDLPYLAMEFLQGEPLDEWLKRRGRPSLAEILRLGIQIGRGLMAAHACGLIHRDIKPGNVFLEIGQGDFRVKILDFGLARLTREHSNLTDPGFVIGTPGYMAPEQVEGKPVDARCDLFSLGCLLYELSTGAAPFPGTSSMAVLVAVVTKAPRPPRELNPDLPPAMAKLILRLLIKDPLGRPGSAREVVEALEGLAGAVGVAAAAKSSGTGAWRARAVAAAILGAALLGGAAWLAWFLSR